MPLTTGTKLGPYEIVSPAGAGGMGEVYRARDTRLDRQVAIKILPASLSTSPEIRERFEREARAVSKLSHPNICVLHDVGRESGVDFIVMEYLEGETLEARLEKGPLPPDQILKLAIQIADALEKAHRQGIIHRDLKPANIMLTKSGAKLMDFGLAKQVETSPVATALTELTAADRKLTTEGTILGTFAYMAPEQLEGAEADARTDIFAFGEILYEMATGQPPFKGRTKASLIASILSSEPAPIASVQPLTPPALERVVKICLQKDPADRFQSAHDLKLQLEWIAEGGSQAGVPAPVAARRKQREWIAWGAAAVLAIAAGLAGWFAHQPATPQVMRSTISVPVTLELQNEGSLALSPDGRKLAIAGSTDNKLQIFIRALDSTSLQPLVGTEGATYPFWSPDGQYVGFFGDGKLKKVPAEGGTVQTICPAEDGRGASWGPDDTIVFAPGPYSGLFTVPAAGGTPTELTHIDGSAAGLSHRVPSFLPDGEHVLFFQLSADNTRPEGMRLVSLKDKKITNVTDERSAGMYVEPGYLFFIREGNLMAQRFNTSKLALEGAAAPIAEDVQFHSTRRTGTFTASPTGLLVYLAGAEGGKTQGHWYDLYSGKDLGKAGSPRVFISLDLAPDGKRAIARIADTRAGTLDLWLYDLDRDVLTRLTTGRLTFSVVWAPDGKKFAFAENKKSSWTIYERDLSGGERVLVEGPGERVPNAYSLDGKYLTFQQRSEKDHSWDLWALPLTGGAKPYAFLSTPANELNAGFSPDTKWLSYVSDDSGRNEVYVVPFPGPGQRSQISADGAQGGGWDRKGRFFFAGLDAKFYTVKLTPHGGQLDIGRPQVLIGGASVANWRYGSITWDGDRVLALLPVEQGAAPNLTLVTNWQAALRKK